MEGSEFISKFVYFCSISTALLIALFAAVNIRLHAVTNYGRVIHEFDPWFNFRATQYLVDNGWEKFSTWYDEGVWYPLGRPVGTTVYPGMMLTASAIYHGAQHFGLGWTINDVCVFIPAGFAIFTCLATFGLTYEAYRSKIAAVIATGIMAIIPAHLMRSVAGGYDNESVAVFAIVMTFFLWTRSLRNDSSWPFAFITAISYTYMVAAWGAYTFVLNMIGVHAAVLILSGRFSLRLYIAYSIFYFFGTIGALQVQIVGWQPLQSAEQLGPMGVFLGMQVLFVLEKIRVQQKMTDAEFNAFRLKAIAACVGGGSVLLALVLPEGFVGPISARVRGLFVKHTRTGNPLVDSVAEHQATPDSVYFQYFHNVMLLFPVGTVMCMRKRTDAKLFVVAYVLTAGYFSRKMIRLVLLLAPAASVAAGIAVHGMIRWALLNSPLNMEVLNDVEETEEQSFFRGNKEEAKAPKKMVATNKKKEAVAFKTIGADDGKKKSSRRLEKEKKKEKLRAARLEDPYSVITDPLMEEYEKQTGLRGILAVFTLAFIVMGVPAFITHCRNMAPQLSEPQIMLRSRTQDGKPLMIDDFRESYWWLRDNTPEDARVMAWWDYGYQINGVANRTSIADGNTWNHEHIALLGKCLISPEKEAHKLIRHLADYVLVWSTKWAGMYGDDLAKHPHMARIGGSVYHDIDQMGYYLDGDGNPSEKTRGSLLFQLHGYRLDPSIEAPTLFEEAYTSKYNMVRIYKVKNVSQKSKKECVGKRDYPEALKPILAQMNAFDQTLRGKGVIP
jgi:dolichyl-diphosphooligosaccharide--protein glycosyltransferase